MCGGYGGGQQNYGSTSPQGGMQMPKFNPMTTNPGGGPPGHFMNQQPQGQFMPPRFNPMTTNPNGGPPGHFLDQWQGQRPTAPQGYAGSTGTGEPMPMGQQQPAQPTTVPPWMQDPTMGQTFAFNRRPFR